jgi:uncharacterized glyoxalase superfamily protein PhnB
MKNERNRNQAVKAIPDGFHSITPFIIVDNADAFIEFTKKAFGAQLVYRMNDDETNKVVHATVKIGDSMIMLCDAMKGMEPITSMLFLYVDDMDTVYQQAINAKGISTREPRDEFYGDRAACIKDAWGNQWWIATHIEDVSDEELKRRKEQMSNQPA